MATIPQREWPLPRGLIVLLSLAAGIVTIAGLKAASSLVGPIVLALVLTIAVHPVHTAIVRRGLPRWLATVLAMITVYVILLGLAVSLVLALARFATLLPAYEDDFAELLDGIREALEGVGVGDEQIEAVLATIDLGDLAGYLTGVLSGMFSILSNLTFVVILLLFMALDAARFPERLSDTATSRAPLVDALTSFAVGTRRYLAASTTFGFIVAVIDVGVLWILDVPVPLLWGLLAFITNYIPNIGFVIGLVPPAVLALLEGGPDLMIMVIVAYTVINFIIQSVIQPRFVGEAVGLSGTLVFVSLVVWAWILGPIGALLAVPLSLLAKALLVDIDPSTRWLQPLLGGGETDPESPRKDEAEASHPSQDGRNSQAEA